MNENEFWIAVWRSAFGCLALIALTIAGCSTYQTKTIERMTQNGVDAIDAKCAVTGDDGRGLCITRVVSK